MASFWDWRSNSSAAVAAPPVVEVRTTLEPVEIYTASAMVHGLVEPEGRRLSDILNSNSVLVIRDGGTTSLLSGVEGSEGTGWIRIPADEILFVMPPEHQSRRQLRIHRRQHRMRIATGPFELSGNAHLPPGTTLDPYVLRGRVRFLAMTGVHVYGRADPAFERKAPVVLVNVRLTTELKEVVTIS